MSPELPETAESTALATPDVADDVVNPEVAENPAAAAYAEAVVKYEKERAAGRRRGIVITTLVILVISPVLLWLGFIVYLMAGDDPLSDARKQVEEYFQDSEVVAYASVKTAGTPLAGYSFSVEVELVPEVSEEDVCTLLVGADERFGKLDRKQIDLNTIYVRVHGNIPNFEGDIQTRVPVRENSYRDGFTMQEGYGVCARTIEPA